MKLDEAIMKRASVRYFKDDPVSDEEIRALIEAAIRAPTASGLENWLFVVFKERGSAEGNLRPYRRGHGRVLPRSELAGGED